MGKNHDDVAARWVRRALGSTNDAYKSENLLDWGDRIMSYGSHFEVARILKGENGEPRAWLLNGNTYSVTTSRHQRAVRTAINSHSNLPMLTIPHAVLGAAGIEFGSIEIIDVQRDWNTTTVIERDTVPGVWKYETEYQHGGWQNTKTGEFVQRTAYWGEGVTSAPVIDYSEPEPRRNYDSDQAWDEYVAAKLAWEERMRIRHGIWEEVRGTERNTGRKRMVSGQAGGIEWEIIDCPDAPLGYVFQREAHRHWLGASLIRAAVNQRIRKTCTSCSGTGQVEPWYVVREIGEGPMTWAQDHVWHQRNDRRMERNGGMREPMQWFVDAAIEHTECRACGGRGGVGATRRRWAYYLSGFDANETRPSYFFCELPRGVKPTTVEEALETLKPDAVRLAEDMGRAVKRQGDIFAIPMPTLTLRELKARGGVHVRTPKLIEGDGRLAWDGPRPTLFGTNHEGTEIVTVGTDVYARGAIRHVPPGRRPDHKRVTLGKEWHLIMTNTVPR